MTKTTKTKTTRIAKTPILRPDYTDYVMAREYDKRQVEAAGHVATMARVAREEEADQISAWFERCRPVYAPLIAPASTDDLAAYHHARIMATPINRYLGEDFENDLSCYLVPDAER